MDLKARARQLKMDIPAIFIAFRHPQTPWYAKATATLTLIYALSPIDLIPDFIPVFGYLDDLIVLPALVALTVKCIPGPVMDGCREKAKGLWENGKPKKWYYAIPFVLVWIMLILFVLKRVGALRC